MLKKVTGEGCVRDSLLDLFTTLLLGYISLLLLEFFFQIVSLVFSTPTVQSFWIGASVQSTRENPTWSLYEAEQ